jgi:hypothetical protein
VDGDVFAADSGNRLQQELGDVAEGDGLLLGDASLRHQEKDLGQGALDVGGRGEIAAKGYEPRAYEAFVWNTIAAAFPFFSRRVLDAKLCLLDFFNRRKLDFVTREKRILLVAFSRRWVDFRRKSALASVGKMEFAAR